MKFYIGVDGGGTKTAFALFDENKNMLELDEYQRKSTRILHYQKCCLFL